MLQAPTRLKPYLWSACSVVLVINQQEVGSFVGEAPRRHFAPIKHEPRINYLMYMHRSNSTVKWLQ